MIRTLFSFSGFLLLFFPMSMAAKTERFDMRDGALRNLVQFVSDALLEKTVGLSNGVSGWMELDPEKLATGMRGEWEVDVRTFDTEIEPRNEHIRDKVLLAPEFPLATFTLQKVLSVSKPRLFDLQPVAVRLEGILKVKGIAVTQTILMKLTYLPESAETIRRLPGNLLKVNATFDVDTAQFNITIPEPFKGRFSRFIQVTADVMGTDRPLLLGGKSPGESSSSGRGK